jgi:predicted ATPase
MWELGYKIRVTRECSSDDLDRCRKALADLRTIGQDLAYSGFSAQLVHCLAARGEIAAAVELLDDALAEVVRVGLAVLEPELLCFKGDLLRTGDTAALKRAERSYGQVIDVAQRQSARMRMWELRAAVSLARLWRDQSKRMEAHDLLAPIYGWFTEGFDAPDLKKAKALLNELAK